MPTENEWRKSDTLKWTEQTILSNAECSPMLNEEKISDETMCAVGMDDRRQKICYGDIGGPLVIMDGENSIQIGVVSFTRGCNDVAEPDGYIRKTMFLDWISKITGIKRRSMKKKHH